MAVYACSDLHGCYEQWNQIQKFLKPEDEVYVLGDCADRGPDGWGTLKSVLAEPRAILLKGNHEDMLYNVMHEEFLYGYAAESLWLLARNGGKSTYDAWMAEGKDFKYMHILNNLPCYATYTNEQGQVIWLSHSGHPPIKNKHSDEWTIWERSAIWDRDHITQNWHGDENMICVHGHSPVQYFYDEMYPLEESLPENKILPHAYWYCDNHKVNLDNAAFSTGCITLLNLDTWQDRVFF